MKIKFVKFMLLTMLVAPQIIKAQGISYISNLDEPSSGSRAVGSDSWLAIDFKTGDNPGGYLLNSVELGMAVAAGSPSGFSAMIYGLDPNKFGAPFPGTSLGNLNVTSDPASSGIFAFTSDANITLLPLTKYFIVLTAGSSVSSGAYELGLGNNTYSYNPIDGWYGTGILYSSVNGLSWSFAANEPLYAINATAVPEPNTLALFALIGLPWAWRRFCRGS